MIRKIEKDKARFKHIIHGKVRENLRKFISQGEMIGKKGDQYVSIPLPQIDTPRFRFDWNKQTGVGQGEGEVGTPVGAGDDDGDGHTHAGDQPGQHILEVELSMDELAQLLGEELQLPRIEPRGKNTIYTQKDRYAGIRPTGPESLRHFKRTYKEALKRQIASGSYNALAPVIVPIRKDQRYRSWKETKVPESNALIIYCMDVSGSMGDAQKEIVRIESFWIDTWLRYQYKGLECRYIVHDTEATQVDQDTFFRLKESGGTMISSAYRLVASMIEEEFPPDDWNIYVFHFSDGDNWSERDNEECVKLLRDRILPGVNLFGYGQVESDYGSGKFIREIDKHFSEALNVTTSEIRAKDEIFDSIRTFLGKGH